MTAAQERLTAALGGHYRVERELGSGGMATVYLAHDVRHDRKVALKVLRPDLAATIGAERFLREVRITAGLTHPHILPLLDSGEADGLLYFATPHADGGTLRDMLRQQPQLAIETALTIARQVADALAYAHSRGVLHRDIKPENILFESGHAVVADFGIARAISVAGGEKLTVTGLAVGTPAYMSPEQSVGERELDQRSDQYSLACVVYEMLVGEAPFTGPTAQAVLARRMTETPRPVRATRERVSPAVDVAIGRALARIPPDRFASVEEFATALTLPNELGGSATASPRRRHWLAAAAVSLVFLTGAIWMTRQVARQSAAPPVSPRIAVIPFENLGGAADEPFADGITDEITSRLAEISGLRVVSRTSAKRFRGRELSIAELGKALNSDYILEGTVRTDHPSPNAATARITPQLVRVSDDVQVWRQSFNASLTPGAIFGIQADIARRVAAELRITLAGTERARVAKVPTRDSAAYRLYQLGRFHWDKRDAPSLLRAVQYFEEAIARDSTFVDAYAGLAAAAISYLVFFAPDTGFAAAAPALAAARRAVALDSASAAAQAGLGYVLMIAEWNWAGADSAFQRAINLDAEYGPARYWYAQLLWVLWRFDDALEQAQLAVAVDPLSAISHLAHARTLRLLGRSEESLAALTRTVELQPTLYAAYGDLAAHYARAGRHNESAQAAKQFLLHSGHPTDAARVQETADAIAGRGKADRIGRLLDRPGAPATHVAAARWFAAAGLRDSAFARLRAAVAVHSFELYFIPPHMARLLGDDPRWAPLMQSMGLQPRVPTAQR